MRALIRLCFRRPVAVSAVTALLVALSAVAYVRLPVALLPDLGYPALTVWTAYPDVPPERVEQTVTEPVEEAVAGTEGLERVTARSQLGGSLVELRFGWNTDLDRALLGVREQINRLGNRLPEAAEQPVVLRVDPSDRPIMMLALRGTRTDTSAVRRASDEQKAPQNLVRLREVVSRRLEQLRDVARVRVTGGYQREVRVKVLSPAESDLLIDLVAEERRRTDAALDTLLQHLQVRPELAGVRRAEAAEVPAYRLRLKREVMARYGVRPEAVGRALEAAARGREATALRQVGREIPILVHSRDVASIDALLQRSIETPSGRLPLRRFVQAESAALPAALLRSEQAPIVRLVADVAEDCGLSEAVDAVQSSLAATLPPGVRGQVGGANRAFRESLRAVGWSLLLSLLLVYLILTAQFERLRQPFVILAAVPLAAAGVAAVLWGTGQTINLMSLTGCVVLVGIVVNDAIIKVDFINQRRERGMSLREAIEAAGRARSRPILMTTITTVLGLLPLALGLGAGAEIRAPLAIAIVGGLLSATVLTLLVVPVLYQAVASRL